MNLNPLRRERQEPQMPPPPPRRGPPPRQAPPQQQEEFYDKEAVEFGQRFVTMRNRIEQLEATLRDERQRWEQTTRDMHDQHAADMRAATERWRCESQGWEREASLTQGKLDEALGDLRLLKAENAQLKEQNTSVIAMLSAFNAGCSDMLNAAKGIRTDTSTVAHFLPAQNYEKLAHDIASAQQTVNAGEPLPAVVIAGPRPVEDEHAAGSA